MKNKFVVMVASLLLVFIFATTMIWEATFVREIRERETGYAKEMADMANENVGSYLKKMRLVVYILQNSSLSVPILNKAVYQDDSERLMDMKNMQTILKSVMTGAEYMQNIYVFRENEPNFMAEGAYVELSEAEVEYYKQEAEGRDIFFGIKPPRDKYDYPRMILVKKLELGKDVQQAWVMMMINCRGIYGIYNNLERYDTGLLIWDDDNALEIYQNNLEYFMPEKEITKESLEELADQESGKICKFGNARVLVLNMRQEETGWQSIVLIPYEQLYGEHKRLLMINISVLLLVCMSAIALCRVLAERFLRNIELLTQAVEKIQKDNIRLDVVITSRDEAEVLYHRFEAMISRIQEQIIDIRKHEKEKRVLTLKALQAQINPHFLYNSLNTIKWMSKMQGANAVADAVSALSSIMQVSMSPKTYLTFREELDYLNKYICMLEYQKAVSIKFVCKLEEELESLYILKMLIQPVVENALKHGRVMDKSDGYISVSIYQEGKDIQIDVEDNGCGLSEDESNDILEHLQEGNGIGLFNIQKRIQLYYGQQYGVSITGEKGIYTRVSLRIPRREQLGEEDDQSIDCG